MISIVVPVYNSERTLRTCIDSILKQSYTDYELLLIDDGSTDQSGLICDEYAKNNPQIKTYHKANSGVSSARNIGINHAHGEWITFCDSDDYVSEYWLSLFIENCTGCDLVVQGFNALNKSFPLSTGINYKGNVQKGLSLLATHSIIGYVWVKLFRLDIIKKNNLLFNENFRYREDEDFVLKYLSIIEIMTCIDKQAYNYTVPDWISKYQQSDNFYLTCSMYRTIRQIYARSFNSLCQSYLDELNFALFNSIEQKKTDRVKRIKIYQHLVGRTVLKSQINTFSKWILYVIQSPRIVSWLFDFKANMMAK